MKKILNLILIITLIISFCPIVIFAETNVNKNDETEIFYDDFSNSKLDTSKWLIAKKAWGGKNGGVVPENISISDGILKLEGHGDLYEGDVEGIKKPDGKRTGAAIATKDYYASGSYEVIAKVAPELGACSAIWTFEYEEYYPGDSKYEELAPNNAPYYVVNHEIDIEMPGRASNSSNPSYEYALCNTWVGERGNEHTTSYTKLPVAQNDGEFHKYRFDWHTGDEGITPCVEFYFDDELITVNTTHVPTNESRLWIGLWFPNGWAGSPEFDTTVFEIDSVKITPFHEAGDTRQNETYANSGWFIEEDQNLDVLQFNMKLDSNVKTVKPGDVFEVTGLIDEIEKNNSKGLMVIGGTLEYDKNLLDLEEVEGLGTWNFSDVDYNEENGKFIIVANKYVEVSGEVFKLKFKVKDDANFENTEIVIKDVQGATGQYENGLVDCQNIAKVIIEIKEEETYILGDVDGNGIININDLAQMKLHSIEVLNLEGVHFKAADLDKNGILNINDIAMMKLVLINELEL